MQQETMIERTNACDLIPIFSGHEICCPNHSFGPFIREYYILHFCLHGEGKLSDKFGTHKIQAGEFFIIRPDELTTYTADGANPWEYTWIAFHGKMSDVFNTERSVYPFPRALGEKLRELAQANISAPSAYLAVLYELLYQVFHEKNEQLGVAERIKRYIDFNYMQDLSVLHLANRFGFERSYLFRIFKRAVGCGIKQYLVKVRMEQAQTLLNKGHTVSAVGFAVGYKDPFVFSKAFKNYFGYSPKGKK
ncbi:MAG: AraC family transcriptional regulator [Clostridia bacterium]|nr:AraC family transcriptional regulator [Clostridia bacterium]